MNVRIGTFNVLNLARPGERYYPDEAPYSVAEYEEKAAWTAGQLRRMAADLVGFQEVFHEEALRDVCGRSGRFDGATVVAPGADGVSGPRLGLATRLPLAEPVSTVVDFPDGLDAVVDGVGLPVGTFSRPVLRARVVLDPALDTPATVFVAHLKSKRPIRDPQAPEHDPREEALGKARALVRRAAEAAALRFLVLDEVVGNARPAFVLGDLNDAARAVSTDIVMGDAPSRSWPRAAADRRAYWDRLLYSTYEMNARRVGRDISYTHVFNGHYETLDHVLVSQEFHDRNPDRIGEVSTLRYFNDHLFDSQLGDERRGRVVSDHGQVVAEVSLR
ncbi:endonuclease/exonuclease/phosphatase family metal-dependent hydrolase [Geodermatophilus bullaregiensis]|uniref:endonuclease/exonuclease/phosphatase family protein n=1 Tax=Geodermatophilus bullaregiensis TaxID=1564160 RepID=UPI00195ADF84|nr:endonuclease/exonuclease/phosphatase family protein [Geodermatophilus bullaregiensis]MBM7809053.1 endonuclease/exonuclease/phosphatase family metal-dependent hydrolase [Geodermatophilus bullaregiensis]